MRQINITELRNHLSTYIGKVNNGEQFLVTSRGKVVASLIPVRDAREVARKRLAELRACCTVGDVVSPIGEKWKIDTSSFLSIHCG